MNERLPMPRGAQLQAAPLILAALPWLACTAPSFTDARRGEDAGRDAASALDAGGSEANLDASPAQDAQSSSDAGRLIIEGSESLCGTDAALPLPGEECAGIVHCGNAKTCDVTTRNCCLAFGGVGDECTLDPCTTTDVIRETAMCDGPEDCPSDALCCFQGGSSACASSCAPGSELCHGDADCTVGSCVPGRIDLGVRLWKYWGFCES